MVVSPSFPVVAELEQAYRSWLAGERGPRQDAAVEWAVQALERLESLTEETSYHFAVRSAIAPEIQLEIEHARRRLHLQDSAGHRYSLADELRRRWETDPEHAGRLMRRALEALKEPRLLELVEEHFCGHLRGQGALAEDVILARRSLRQPEQWAA